MKRHEWTFEKTAGVLAQAAQAKKEHHLSRVKWWEGEREKVLAKIKDSGLTVHESLVSQYSKSGYNSGPPSSAQIMVDTTMQKDLDETTTKIREHKAAVDQYDGWAQVLTVDPGQRFLLNQDDFLFFFGK